MVREGGSLGGFYSTHEDYRCRGRCISRESKCRNEKEQFTRPDAFVFTIGLSIARLTIGGPGVSTPLNHKVAETLTTVSYIQLSKTILAVVCNVIDPKQVRNAKLKAP